MIYALLEDREYISASWKVLVAVSSLESVIMNTDKQYTIVYICFQRDPVSKDLV